MIPVDHPHSRTYNYTLSQPPYTGSIFRFTIYGPRRLSSDWKNYVRLNEKSALGGTVEIVAKKHFLVSTISQSGDIVGGNHPYFCEFAPSKKDKGYVLPGLTLTRNLFKIVQPEQPEQRLAEVLLRSQREF